MEVEDPMSYFNVKDDEEISFDSDDEKVLMVNSFLSQSHYQAEFTLFRKKKANFKRE